MAQASYSRLGYMAIKAETTENVAVLPNVFIPILKEDIVTKYGVSLSMSVAGNRSLSLHGVPKAIDAPSGKISINVEPKTLGHFLKGVYGNEVVGIYLPIQYRLSTGTVTGTPAVGATLLQATSLSTATVTSYPNLPWAATFGIRDQVGAFNSTNVVTGTNPDGTTFTFTPTATFPAGNFQVGETITGSISTKTAVVVAISAESDYLLVSTMSGTMTAGETLTGSTSTKKATLGSSTAQIFTTTGVYGHEFKAPVTGTTVPSTFTVEIGYVDAAYRLTGVRFHEIAFAQKNNIMTADITLTARTEFKHARITSAANSGGVTLYVDQTTGLVAGDTVQTFSPVTGLYTNTSATITAITSETSVTITLATGVALGDLLVLRPQTSSYSTVTEFSWVGASQVQLSDVSMLDATTKAASNIEDYSFSIVEEIESRHAANGINTVNRFPSANFLKGLKASGKIDQVYVDMTQLDRLRTARPFSIQVTTTADLISTSGQRYELDLSLPQVIFQAFAPTISEDGLLDQKMPFDALYGTTAGYFTKTLLVNDVASY